MVQTWKGQNVISEYECKMRTLITSVCTSFSTSPKGLFFSLSFLYKSHVTLELDLPGTEQEPLPQSEKFFILIRSTLSIFPFLDHASSGKSKNTFPNPILIVVVVFFL